MLTCPACGGREIGARVEPNGSSVHFCRGCESVVSTQAPQATRPHRQHEATEAPKPQAAPVASRNPQHAAPENPIPAMRRRMRWLDTEIRRLRKLEAERETLSRILSAATGKPTAVVRAIKCSNG